jgi:hypothetical protein
MIDFEWAVHEHTANLFMEALEQLEIVVEEAPSDDADAHVNDAVFELLERAGLMLDQQVRMPDSGGRVVLVGSTDAETLAQALIRFAHERDAGGVLVDMATSPAQITEVRGINGPIVVLADEQGARQLQLDRHLISSALEHASSS